MSLFRKSLHCIKRELKSFVVTSVVAAMAVFLMFVWAGDIHVNGSGPTSRFRYKVVRGDSVLGIVRRFGLRTNELVAANPGLDPHRLVPGTALVIPGPPILVKLGGDLDGVARRFGFSSPPFARLAHKWVGR